MRRRIYIYKCVLIERRGGLIFQMDQSLRKPCFFRYAIKMPSFSPTWAPSATIYMKGRGTYIIHILQIERSSLCNKKPSQNFNLTPYPKTLISETIYNFNCIRIGKELIDL